MLIKLDSWQLATAFSWYIVVYRIGCAPVGWSDACRSLGCDAFLAYKTTVSGLGLRRRATATARRTAAVVVYAICAYQLSGTRSLLNMNWITRHRASTEDYGQNLQILQKKDKQKFVNRYFFTGGYLHTLFCETLEMNSVSRKRCNWRSDLVLNE